jgi:hypothetical protein
VGVVVTRAASQGGVLQRVELLVDVGLGADEVLRPPDRLRELLSEDDGAVTIRGLVRDPVARGIELGERIAQLVDRRLGLEDVPDEEADDPGQSGPRGS